MGADLGTALTDWEKVGIFSLASFCFCTLFPFFRDRTLVRHGVTLPDSHPSRPWHPSCPFRRALTLSAGKGVWDHTADEKELITSATTLGALLGGLAAGTLSDYTGRKPVIAMSNGVFILGALLQAVSF